MRSDLSVELVSEALKGRTIDFIVSGSIGAVESPRLIRALRRLGASVRPWLTEGGRQFITPMSLEWASAQTVQERFSGTNSHIAEGDACVIAPASAHLIAKIAWGDTDTPASALVTSYLGSKKPVLLLPAMHDSLWQAPTTKRNIDTVKAIQNWVTFLSARTEEGKQKMPTPEFFANEVAHQMNRRSESVLVTMGSTRGYLDDVRYVSNYSSGALGSLVSEELYRRGFETQVVHGAAAIKPQITGKLICIDTNEDMLKAIKNLTFDAAVCAASVLDYIPKTKQAGKVRSQQKDLSVELIPTEKIIAKIQPRRDIKIGFKLEPTLDQIDAKEIASTYTQRYGLSCLVVNSLTEVDAKNHKAQVFENLETAKTVSSKAELAQFIANHIVQRMT